MIHKLGKGVKFLHLFSDDEGKRVSAKLMQLMHHIKGLIDMSGIKEVKHPEGKPISPGSMREAGPVKVRYCKDDKTYFGIYIGDMALSTTVNIDEEKLVCEYGGFNPAIFVPALGKVVYGCESWWGPINGPEDLEDITDDDINNVWYVKAIMDMAPSNCDRDHDEKE